MVGQVLCGRFLRCKRRVSRRSDAGFFAKLIGVNFNACPSHVEEHFQPLGLRQLRVDLDHDARGTSANVCRSTSTNDVGTKGAGEGFCVFVNDESDKLRTQRLGQHRRVHAVRICSSSMTWLRAPRLLNYLSRTKLGLTGDRLGVTTYRPG